MREKPAVINNTACLWGMYFQELTIFLIPRQSRRILLLWEPAHLNLRPWLLWISWRWHHKAN